MSLCHQCFLSLRIFFFFFASLIGVISALISLSVISWKENVTPMSSVCFVFVTRVAFSGALLWVSFSIVGLSFWYYCFFLVKKLNFPRFIMQLFPLAISVASRGCVVSSISVSGSHCMGPGPFVGYFPQCCPHTVLSWGVCGFLFLLSTFFPHKDVAPKSQ